MTGTISQLPLLSYEHHVLPGGRLPLRIVEPRHIRMVKESYQREHAFALCMHSEEDETIYPIVTLVKIIDFEPLAHNMLGVIVEGINSLVVDEVTKDDEGLEIGECQRLDLWEPIPLHAKYADLAEMYQQFLSDNPKLEELYPEPDLSNASWVAQRWLELLPIPAKEKQMVMGNECPEYCLEILSQLNLTLENGMKEIS
ncbi:MAG: LON peptidase substrate-binding domain-containing protein [Cellvibrionales bacterium]|nr:LON peptidase substrate-binding domain-containing protein [Cellvibrionales bacterium]